MLRMLFKICEHSIHFGGRRRHCDLELGYCYNSRDNLLNTTLKGLITCTDLGSLSFCYSVGD